MGVDDDGSRLNTDLGGDQSGGGYGFKGKHRKPVPLPGRLSPGRHSSGSTRIGKTGTSGGSSRGYAAGSDPRQPSKGAAGDSTPDSPVGSPRYIEQYHKDHPGAGE